MKTLLAGILGKKNPMTNLTIIGNGNMARGIAQYIELVPPSLHGQQASLRPVERPGTKRPFQRPFLTAITSEEFSGR